MIKKYDVSKKLLAWSWLAVSFMIHFDFASGATTYYSAINGGNWNASSSWSTVTYGSGVNSGTYPVTGDIALIGDGFTINITSSCGASVIAIGQGTSGILQYTGTGLYTLTVSGSITINTGGKFWYNSNNSRIQGLFISGNFTNNGIVDLYYDTDDKVNLTFNSNTNSIVSGTGTWKLNDVSLTKSSLVTKYLDVQTNAFENAISNLNLIFGTYIHNNTGTYNVNAGGSSFTINDSGIFKVPAGTVNFSPSSNYCYLYGSLYVNGGNVSVGSTAGNNGLRYKKPGSIIPYLEISSGTMTVYGGITYESGATSDPFSFKMTGGTLLLNNGSSGTMNEPFFINDVSNSIFNMTGGTITLQEPNYTGGSVTDFGICGISGIVNVTGGIIEFGNLSTTNNKTFNFLPFANVTQPHYKISGTAAYNIKLQPSNNSTGNIKLLSLYIEAGKTFDVRSISGTAGDTKTLTLTGTYDGTNALINDGTFTARNGTIIFTSTVSQGISGMSTTTFYNLTINNSNHITLYAPVNVTDSLNLSTGKLITSSTNTITGLSGAMSNIGNTTSYVDGPFIQTVASSSPVTFNLPIGSGSSYHPLLLNVQHTNATAVTYKAQIYNSAASSLPFALPFTLSKVSDIRYYTINRQAIANFSSGNIKIYYYTDDVVTDYSNLRVAQDDGSANWINEGGVGTANSTGTITSGNFSSFNTTFALANAVGGSNPLPVELVKFTAEPVDDMVNLNWETASEINTDYFTIERSYSGINYIPTSRLKAFGNSTNSQFYHSIDRPGQKKTMYYRLKITDFNGHSDFSKIVSVNFLPETEINIFPSPSNGKNIHIKLNKEDIKTGTVKAFDLDGNEIEIKAINNPAKHEIIAEICPASKPRENTYIIQVSSNGKNYMKKMLIVR